MYVVSFLLSVVSLGTAAYRQRHASQLSLIKPGVTELEVIDDEIHNIEGDSTTNRYYQFLNRYLVVHGLIVAADWLQGAYLYSVYRHNHQLPDHVVVSLMAIGFVFSGLGTPFAAPLADRMGRKQACLLHCLLLGLSSLTVLSGSIPILAAGRALVGMSACLQPVFDMWMLGDLRRLDLGHSEEAVRYVHRSVTVINGFVSVGVGVISQILVRIFASDVAPFLGSTVCLAAAHAVISKTWMESYESRTQTRAATPSPLGSLAVLAIGVSLFALEASTSLVFAFWAPSIISARDTSFTWSKGKIPFGLVFSQLMSALTLGSLMFTHVSAETGKHPSLVRLSLAACSLCLLAAVATGVEIFRFWSLYLVYFFVGFCTSGIACIMEGLREEQRARINEAVRVPLTMLVVGSLITVEDDYNSRGDRWMVCSGFLLLATVSMTLTFPRPKQGQPTRPLD